MSKKVKKDKKQYQCYQCKKDIIGYNKIAGWDIVEWLAQPDWDDEWVPICGDCSNQHTVDKINELYDGDDEINYWRNESMGC